MEIAKTASDALKILWKTGFFLEPKTLSEIKKKLHKNGYNFLLDLLNKALNNANFLTKNGKRGSYTYTQKYPYLEEKKNG